MVENASTAQADEQSQSRKVSWTRYRFIRYCAHQSSRLNLLLLLALMLAWRDPGLTNSKEYISHLMETRPGDAQLKRLQNYLIPTRSTISVFLVGTEKIPTTTCDEENETNLPNCTPTLDGMSPSK